MTPAPEPQRSYVGSLARAIRQHTAEQTLPDDASADELDRLFELYALVGLLQGEGATLEHVHDAWSAWMVGRGQGDHASVVPFAQLDTDAQQQDAPFLHAIQRAVVERPSNAARRVP